MMLSPLMIKKLIANMQLAIRDEAHFKQLMDGLYATVNDQHLDGQLDSFAFAWNLLPQWARALLLSVAYREDKTIFCEVTPLTPIHIFNPPQRALLANGCDKLLSAVITLTVDADFTEGFYQTWLSARRSALKQQTQLEKIA